MVAVLVDAANCILHPRNRRAFNEACKWIRNENRAQPFSFGNICEVLALDPSYVRRGLQPWIERGNADAAATAH